MAKSYIHWWPFALIVLAIYVISKAISSQGTGSGFTGLTSQRGVFGTGTGLYGTPGTEDFGQPG
jgi:hypothetical protein